MNSKLQTQFKSMEVRNSSFSAFIDLLTPNTYVMVVISDPDVCKYIHTCMHTHVQTHTHTHTNAYTYLV